MLRRGGWPQLYKIYRGRLSQSRYQTFGLTVDTCFPKTETTHYADMCATRWADSAWILDRVSDGTGQIDLAPIAAGYLSQNPKFLHDFDGLASSRVGDF